MILVTVLSGAGAARPLPPVPQPPKPIFIQWLMRKVIVPVVVAGAKDLVATAIRSAIVSLL